MISSNQLKSLERDLLQTTLMLQVYSNLNKKKLKNKKKLRPDAEDYSDIGTLQSIFAGLGSGLIQIPKGVMSLGASVYDLINDTNKAAEIEKYFDDLTEHGSDDTAEQEELLQLQSSGDQQSPGRGHD